MFFLKLSTHLKGSPDSVFEYVSDYRHAPDWQRHLLDVRLDDGPFPAGTRLVEVRSLLGLRVEARGELVEWSRPHGLTLRGTSGPLRVRSRYTLTESGRGTSLDLELVVASAVPIWPVEWLLRRVLTRQLEQDMRRLTVVLDGSERAPDVVLGPVTWGHGIDRL